MHHLCPSEKVEKVECSLFVGCLDTQRTLRFYIAPSQERGQAFNFPVELLHMIFLNNDLVKAYHVAFCALVCRTSSWKPPALFVLYQNFPQILRLPGVKCLPNIFPVYYRLECFSKCLALSLAGNGKRIRQLNFLHFRELIIGRLHEQSLIQNILSILHYSEGLYLVLQIPEVPK